MPADSDALVLLCCGDREQIAALQAAAAEPLAAALKLPAGRLELLPVDPGMSLAGEALHRAAQLGAARRSCLLLLSAEQLGSGVAAATTALLAQWQVPLLGLVQWGSPWLPEARRLDGLPWLGWLEAGNNTAGSDSAAALRQAAALRWQLLRAEQR
ncbi:MAG: hypothetical protein VKL97_04810 [Cyanobacteriota bacterium]|nr:hypothetical protein [Cyanobacteriota bacterium]